jgi:ABC-type branched-subunit amino acid transport system ATPase component
MHEDSFHSKANSEAYRENYKKIFGDTKVEKGSFIWVDGEIVSCEEEQKSNSGITFIPEMKEGVSPVTGEVISSRRAMKEHCKRHNVYYIGR